jgi:Uma2 family endonuclease
MPMALPHYCTPDLVRQLPDDGNRYETVHGELLVTPAPRLAHQYLVGQLFRALADYCDSSGVGMALMSPADLSLAPDSLVQPDVFVVPSSTDRDASWHEVARPLLVVEVLSPGTAHADRFTKRLHYQRAGVPVYWICDGAAPLVEVWTPDAVTPVLERRVLTWSPFGAAAPLMLPLERVFD